MKKNYNELVRFYNRSRKKLQNLVAQGKNAYKQDILKRRITRLFQLLTGMQTQVKLSTATFALAAGFVLFQPNAANAQTFGPKQTNPFGLSNGGAWTVPSFVDLDNDGDKDIMVGLSTGGFVYYQNTGTASAAAYGAPTPNPFGLVATGSPYSCVAIVDYDNDGDYDMMSGAKDGSFYYFENGGTAAAPNFISAVVDPDGLVALGAGYSAGSFVDLDNDGDKDFMAGDYAGNFFYFQNTGTASAPAFAASVQNAFGLAMTTGGYSTTCFVDLDGDGDKDMFSSNGPSFDYFQNTGTAAAPAFAAVMALPFSLTTIGTNNGASNSFADINNDGDLDMISGISTGDVIYYENTSPTGIKNHVLFSGLSIYPNPTNSNVTLQSNSRAELSIEVTNVLGQVVSSFKTDLQTNTVSLPETKGVYFVKVTNTANESNTYKIVKN